MTDLSFVTTPDLIKEIHSRHPEMLMAILKQPRHSKSSDGSLEIVMNVETPHDLATTLGLLELMTTQIKTHAANRFGAPYTPRDFWEDDEDSSDPEAPED